MRKRTLFVGLLLLGWFGAAEAAMWGSQNGSALKPLAGEGGSYTSCVPGPLSTTNDQPALNGMVCSATGKAWGFRFDIPQGETPTTVDIGLVTMGNGTAAETGCFSVQCGCGGNNTTELELSNVTYGTAAAMTITSAVGWTSTESKTTVVTGIALENGGEYRSCVCRFVRMNVGGCTDNWTGGLNPAGVMYKW